LIYAANQQIFIKNVTAAETDRRPSPQLTVTEITGRIILQQQIPADDLVSVPVNLQIGIYVVNVQSGYEVKTEKIFIK
jgi:hypothetical protein